MRTPDPTDRFIHRDHAIHPSKKSPNARPPGKKPRFFLPTTAMKLEAILVPVLLRTRAIFKGSSDRFFGQVSSFIIGRRVDPRTTMTEGWRKGLMRMWVPSAHQRAVMVARARARSGFRRLRTICVDTSKGPGVAGLISRSGVASVELFDTLTSRARPTTRHVRAVLARRARRGRRQRVVAEEKARPIILFLDPFRTNPS